MTSAAHYDEDRLQRQIQGAVAEASKVEKKDKDKATRAAKADKKKKAKACALAVPASRTEVNQGTCAVRTRSGLASVQFPVP